MNLNFLRSGTLLAVVLLFAGCSDPPPHSKDRASDPTAPELMAMLPAVTKASFGLVPERLSCVTEKRNASVVVWWDASKHKVSTVSVYVSDGENKPFKLWTEGGAIGRDVTGEWIHEGSVLELRERATNRVLERLTVVSKDC